MSDELAARVHALIAQWREEAKEVAAMMADDPQADLACCDDTAICLCNGHASALEAALAAALAPNPENVDD